MVAQVERIVGFDVGPAGLDHVDVDEGGFVHAPALLVHREVNDEPSAAVLAFVGSGPVVVNLAAPEQPEYERRN
jgi:hypothetical protein